MAWLLAGVGAAIGIGYLYDVMTTKVNEVTKPLYDYKEKEDKDSEQRILEELRQEDIERKKEGHKKRDIVREKYVLKERNTTQIINNTEEVCTIIFVNYHHAKNDQEAITWSKQVIENKYFDGQVMNKMNTKKLKLGVTNTYELIDRELNEYYIVVKCSDKFSVLEKNIKGNITVTSLFEIKRSDGVDVSCKWRPF